MSPNFCRLLALALLLVAAASPSHGQLSGALSGTLGPGTFTVNGHISVNAGDSLRLLPGTTFQFVGVYRFEVYGTLLAEGTQADSIRFTCDTTAVTLRWRKIRFYTATSSGSRLSYCVVEHARGTDVFPQLNGGGIYCSNTNPDFEHCTIRRNLCDLSGGGIYCNGSSPTIRYCKFENNVATQSGGGIALQSNSIALLEECTFLNNSAANGGGVVTQTSSDAILSRCEFLGNQVSGHGGGAYIFGASPQLYDCVFRYNAALATGGAVVVQQSSSVLEHCTIASNSSDSAGGSVYVGDATARIVSTLILNSNDYGLFVRTSTGALIEYCNVYGSALSNVGFHNNSPSQGPAGLGVLSTRNANRDSCDAYFNLYRDPQIIDTTGGVYEFVPCTSPLFGAGKPSPTSLIDAVGHPRPDPPLSAPEIGAHESELEHGALRGVLTGVYGPGRYIVCDSITVVYPDSARLLPGTTFQFADSFRFILTGRLLAEGTETDSIVFTADTVANPNKWRGLRFTNQNSSSSRLRYCVIENGRAIGSSNNPRGGAVYCSANSNPQFTNCSIRNCRAEQFGGAVYATSASPVFTSCVIDRCFCAQEGGAFYLTNASPQISFCTISRCSATSTGGAAWISAGSPAFTRNTIVSNSAPSQGGGVYLISSTASFNSNIISHSTGIGVYFRTSPSTVFRYNDVTNNSGGNIVLHSQAPVPPQAPSGVGINSALNANGDSCDAYFNVRFDPDYVNRIGGDYQLLETSPCIDAGDPALPLELDDTVADMGAYFFDQSPPLPPDSARNLVIEFAADSIRLAWESEAQLFYIYGSVAPDSSAVLLDSVTSTGWIDPESATRPTPFFYHVTAERP